MQWHQQLDAFRSPPAALWLPLKEGMSPWRKKVFSLCCQIFPHFCSTCFMFLHQWLSASCCVSPSPSLEQAQPSPSPWLAAVGLECRCGSLVRNVVGRWALWRCPDVHPGIQHVPAGCEEGICTELSPAGLGLAGSLFKSTMGVFFKCLPVIITYL